MEAFDPIKRAEEVEKIVMNGYKRRYYRFRRANFYGGVITADAVGCNLLCAYCWNYAKNEKPATGNFFSAEEVAGKLIKLAEKNNLWRFRISGCEPFLGEASAMHLADIIYTIDSYNDRSSFIIETNGVMLGYDPSLLELLPKLEGSISRRTIRVALKGMDEEQSLKVTNAIGAHAYQMQGIKTVCDKRLKCIVAKMPEFVGKIEGLPVNAGTETEKLKMYSAKKRLVERGLI